jgi:hypothetical protein
MFGSKPAVARAIQTAATGPVLKTRAAVKKKAAAAVSANPMQQIVNRYIASLLTPKQQQAQAQAGIDAQLKASLAAINTAYGQENTTLQRQQERARTYALALNSMRDMSGAQTEADYQNAAARIQGLGTGLTGTIADAQQQTANDAAAKIAAATGGLGQAQGLDVAGLKNIAQYTGVTMPATDLYSEAANQAAQARLQQDVRGQQVENIAGDWGQKIADAAMAHAGKVADVQATRPSLYQAAIQAAQTGNRSDLATIISALALQNTPAQTPSKIALTGAKTKGTEATTKKTVATTAATKTGTKVKVATAEGTTPTGNKPAPGNYFVGSNPKTRVAQPIPPHQKLDPTDPTYQRTVPDPNNPPPGQHYNPKTKSFQVNPSTASASKKATPVQLGKMNPAQLASNGYYRPSPGAAPQKIPTGSHVDTVKDPNKLIPDKAPTGPKPPKASDIKIYSSEVTAALKPPKSGSNAYLKPDPSQTPLDKVANGPRYIPRIPTAQARAQLLALYPANMRKLPQVIAFVNTTLAGAGFK